MTPTLFSNNYLEEGWEMPVVKSPARLRASSLNPEVQEDLLAVTVKTYLLSAPSSCSGRSMPNHTW